MVSKFLAATLAAVLTVSSTAQAYPVHDKSPQIVKIMKNVGIIKETNLLIDVSALANQSLISIFTYGLAVEGMVSYGLFARNGIWQSIGKFTIKFGVGVMVVSGVGLVVGVAYEVFAPTNAYAATMSDYYATPEGFAKFLELPADAMTFHANENPQLAAMLDAVAQAVVKTNSPQAPN